MRRFYLPLCFLDFHVPDRRQATWDGFNYVSTCRICRRKVRRRENGRWVRDRLIDWRKDSPSPPPDQPKSD